MSRVCPVLGKGPVSGNNRSHSLRATRRRWNTNLQVRTVVVDGKEMSGYEVTQQMRRVETAVRAQKATKQLAQASGDKALVKKLKEVNSDEEKAMYWLTNGAQPTDTVRNLLSQKGSMAKYAESKKKDK